MLNVDPKGVGVGRSTEHCKVIQPPSLVHSPSHLIKPKLFRIPHLPLNLVQNLQTFIAVKAPLFV